MGRVSATDHRPHITIHDDSGAVSRAAAGIIADLLRTQPDAVLGLATGGTMVSIYAHLAGLAAAGEISFDQVRSFNLDEYIGLPSDHPQSYRHFMNIHLADPAGLDPARMEIPSGVAPDLEAETRRYEAALAAAGPIALQLLGLGGNGHIGFNEPGSAEDSRTRVVTLDTRTVRDNARFFERKDEVPRQAISMGVASILQAERLLLVACGAAKAEAVRAMIDGPISPDCPASFLRRHADVRVILDREAASLLQGGMDSAANR